VRKHHGKNEVGFQSNTSHNKLNEEVNCYTEDTEAQENNGRQAAQEKASNNEEEENEDDVILFIEYKYCTVCHIEQPLRCKHC
jgi:hypothetical protein